MNKIRHPWILLLLPVAIWIFLFRDFLDGSIVISSENFQIYSIVKYFFDNLRSGVWPLWDVYVLWGAPLHILLNYVGIFNPVWLLVWIFDAAGMGMYQAFVMTTTFYFFAGVAGFYFLSIEFLEDRRAAYAAFLLLLFSSLSFTVYFQFHALLVYVPSVWFFFFLLRFHNALKKRYLIALTFSAMIIFSSFIPFYFITVLWLVLICVGVLYAGRLRALTGWGGFFIRNKMAVLLCVAAFVFSLLPGILAYQSTASHKVVFPSRGESADVFEKGVRLKDYDAVAPAALSGRMSLEDLYRHLDIIPTGDNGFIYFPIFLYVTLALASFLKVNKKMVGLFSVSFILLLIMLTNGSPVHRFLFERIFYFSLMRSPLFFNSFLVSLVILLAAEQLKAFFIMRDKQELTASSRRGWLIWTVLVHASGALFLAAQANVILSSFLALGSSLVFWVILFSGKPRGYFSLLLLLFLSIIIQPAEVLWHHNTTAGKQHSIIEEFVTTPAKKPVFRLTRQRTLPGEESDLFNNSYLAGFRSSMTDSPGFFMKNQTGFATFWSYYISKKVPLKTFQNYTHYKFYVYDRVALVDDDASAVETLNEIFRENKNLALISLDESTANKREALDRLTASQPAESKARIITEEDDSFRIVRFTVNSLEIETNFRQERFLVYTDSFYPGWQAFADGQRIPLYRTNLAFKGIRLPPQKHRILIRFKPKSGVVLPVALWFVFMGFGAATVFMLVKKTGEGRP